MTYILEKMLTVRTHRENKALNHVVKSKAELDRAIFLKNQKEAVLSEYRRWRRNEEQRLFQQLQSQPANIQDLMLFMDATAGLREEQAIKTQHVAEAQKQTITAENNLKAAKQCYAQAYRKKEKIEEHKSIWVEDQRFRMEQEAENEMEEIVRFKL